MRGPLFLYQTTELARQDTVLVRLVDAICARGLCWTGTGCCGRVYIHSPEIELCPAAHGVYNFLAYTAKKQYMKRGSVIICTDPNPSTS